MFLLDASEENPLLYFFQFPEVSCIPWLMALSSNFIACHYNLCFLLHISSQLLTLLPPFYDSSVYTGPVHLTQDNLPISEVLITSEKSFFFFSFSFPCKITYLRFWAMNIFGRWETSFFYLL